MTKRIKVKLIGKGTYHDSYRVGLPTYKIDCKRDAEGNSIWIDEVQGFAEDSCDYGKMECYVLVPDDEVEEITGKLTLNQTRIREKYKNWKNFNAEDVQVAEVLKL